MKKARVILVLALWVSYLASLALFLGAASLCRQHGFGHGLTLLVTGMCVCSGMLSIGNAYVRSWLKDNPNGSLRVNLVVSRRSDDIHVQIEGRPTAWGAGNSVYSAVGNLVTHHPEVFGIVETQVLPRN